MAINPIAFARTVNEQFLRYQLTAFPLADEALARQAEESIRGGGVRPTPLIKGPQERYRTPFRSELLEFVEGCFQFLAMGGSGEDTVKPYPLLEDLMAPAVRMRMRRAANPVPRRSSVGRRAVHA